MTDRRAAVVGAKVLRNLAEGRKLLAEVNGERKAQGAFWRRLIVEFALLEEQDGVPAWGRAGRISRKLKGHIGERMVSKYLAQLTSGSNGLCYGASCNLGGLSP